MTRRLQRGTIDNRPFFWIVLVLVAIGWYNWPGGRPEVFTPTVVNWLVGIGLVLAALFALGLFSWRRDQAYRREVARGLGGELVRDHRTTFGQSTVEYWVAVSRNGCRGKITLDRHWIRATLEVPGGQPAPFSLTATPEGAIAASEADGREAAEAFLDEQVRSNLARMAVIGKPANPAVVMTVGPGHVTVYRQGTMGASETLQFLELCWPVVDRALAHCFGQPVASAVSH